MTRGAEDEAGATGGAGLDARVADGAVHRAADHRSAPSISQRARARRIDEARAPRSRARSAGRRAGRRCRLGATDACALRARDAARRLWRKYQTHSSAMSVKMRADDPDDQEERQHAHERRPVRGRGRWSASRGSAVHGSGAGMAAMVADAPPDGAAGAGGRGIGGLPGCRRIGVAAASGLAWGSPRFRVALAAGRSVTRLFAPSRVAGGALPPVRGRAALRRMLGRVRTGRPPPPGPRRASTVDEPVQPTHDVAPRAWRARVSCRSSVTTTRPRAFRRTSASRRARRWASSPSAARPMAAR